MGTISEIRFAAPLGHGREREFNIGTHYMGALLHAALPPVEADEVRKIIVVTAPDVAEPGRVEDMIDVVSVDVPFDYTSYWDSATVGRRRMLVDAGLRGIRCLADEFGWRVDGYDEVRRVVVERGELVSDHGRAIANRSRKRSVQLRYYYGAADVRIVGVVRNRETGETIDEVEFVRTEPHEYRYVPYLGRVRWESDSCVRLEPRDRGLGIISRSID